MSQRTPLLASEEEEIAKCDIDCVRFVYNIDLLIAFIFDDDCS
jgi:hypothetical protein